MQYGICMANAVLPSHQSPPQQAAALLITHRLATTAYLHPPSLSPPLPNTSITLKSPLMYRKLSKAWRESKPPPKAPEEASRLIIYTFQTYQTPDVEGLLSFYGLPLPHSLVELIAGEAPPLADGLKFELHTLPVDGKVIADGDTVTVYVSTSDTRESSRIPQEVQIAAVERNEACAERNYSKADALHKRITDAGYRVLHINNEDILARKYRIRLRGIDAPETSMPYGKEAKDELVKILEGKCLKILIFGEDRYGRFVGDIYCNGIFVQESMLKKGLAWHYTAYDKRPELDKWEKDARAKRIGLWTSSNPEMPWEWRKNHRQHRELQHFQRIHKAFGFSNMSSVTQ